MAQSRIRDKHMLSLVDAHQKISYVCVALSVGCVHTVHFYGSQFWFIAGNEGQQLTCLSAIVKSINPRNDLPTVLIVSNKEVNRNL